MTEYYLQLADKSHWEKVDEFVYKNWEKAVAEDQQSPRYNGNVLIMSDGGITSNIPTAITPKDFALIARFTGAGPAYVNGNIQEMNGLTKEPEFVRLRLRKKLVARDIANSSCYIIKS